jgi:hypothetical protein
MNLSITLKRVNQGGIGYTAQAYRTSEKIEGALQGKYQLQESI